MTYSEYAANQIAEIDADIAEGGYLTMGETRVEKIQMRAFSILSDVQEEISRGLSERATFNVNVAKVLMASVKDSLRAARIALLGLPANTR